MIDITEQVRTAAAEQEDRNPANSNRGYYKFSEIDDILIHSSKRDHKYGLIWGFCYFPCTFKRTNENDIGNMVDPSGSIPISYRIITPSNKKLENTNFLELDGFLFESFGPKSYPLTEPNGRLRVIDFLPRRSGNEIRVNPDKPYLSRILNLTLSS